MTNSLWSISTLTKAETDLIDYLRSYSNRMPVCKNARLEQKLSIFYDWAADLAQLSTCHRAKVGCIITPFDLSCISAIGYNGLPKGEDNSSCTKEKGACSCIHAEANALIKLRDRRNSILFTTTSPCQHCAGLIVNSGVIRVVVYAKCYRDLAGIDRLEKAGIVVVSLKQENETTVKSKTVMVKTKTLPKNNHQLKKAKFDISALSTNPQIRRILSLQTENNMQRKQIKRNLAYPNTSIGFQEFVFVRWLGEPKECGVGMFGHVYPEKERTEDIKNTCFTNESLSKYLSENKIPGIPESGQFIHYTMIFNALNTISDRFGLKQKNWKLFSRNATFTLIEKDNEWLGM
jgi:deoxycytidylate deaminase